MRARGRQRSSAGARTIVSVRNLCSALLLAALALLVSRQPVFTAAQTSFLDDPCYFGAGVLRKVVSNGCPCVPESTPSEGLGVCPSGHYCGPQPAGNSSSSCLPCPTGTYCPVGTGPIADITEALCPEGHFCPSPAQRFGCDAGDFCPLGSTEPQTCSYLTLLAQEKGPVSIFRETSVLTELVMGRKPWGGNLCPGFASDPFRSCPKGNYCPSASEYETCPAGAKCPTSSTEPTECSSLVLSCPEGTATGSVSLMGVLILALVGVSLLALVLGVRIFSKRVQQRQTNSMAKTDSYMKVKRIILESRLSLHPSHLVKLLKSPMHTCEKFLRAKGAVELEFQDLGLTLKSGAMVLDGVSGRFDPRKLVAIMGPSGAGKSTFLNVLCGKASTYGKMTGTLTVNGQKVASVNERPGKRAVGFVPQDDIVHEDLTVRENLWISAMARLPTHMRHKDKARIIEEILFSLKLDHIEHSIVGSVEKRGISGGQRKRVNIGLELSSLPSLLFLDEPTSGLDSTASTDVLDTLKHCAQLGMTVMTVIHQPRYSIFTGCDDVLFLGKGGRTVYLGPTTFAATYFEKQGFTLPPNDNPADFCIDVLSGSMRREGDMNFKPADLFDDWVETGVAAVEEFKAQCGPPAATSNVAATPKTPDANKRQTIVMPRDIECMANIFRDIDTDGDGLVAPAEVMEYFKNLELDMVDEEVEAFCAGREELTKEDFLDLMRHGPVEETPAKGNHRLQNVVSKAIKPIRAFNRRRTQKSREEKARAKASGKTVGFTSFLSNSDASTSSEAGTSVSGGSQMSMDTAGGPISPTIPAEGSLAASPAREHKRSAVSFVSSTASPAAKLSPLSRLARATNSTGQVSVSTNGPSATEGGAARALWLFRREDDPESELNSPAMPAMYTAGGDPSQGPEDAIDEVEEEVVLEEEEVVLEGAEGATFDEQAANKRSVRWEIPESVSSGLSIRKPASVASSDDVEYGGMEEGRHSPGVHKADPHNRMKCTVDLFRAGNHYWLICYRRMIQWQRSWQSKVLTVVLLAVAGSLLGGILRSHSGMDVVPLRSMLALLTLGLLCGIPSLQVFSNARSMWWRERASGFSPTAHALAGATLDTFDVCIRPMVFLAAFYYFVLPHMSFWDGYLVALLASWYASGLAYMLSSLLDPPSASLALVCTLMVVGGLFSGVLPTLASMRGTPLYYINAMSYTRWGAEAMTLLEYAGYAPYQQPPATITLAGIGYCDMDIKLGNLQEQINSGLTVVLDGPEIVEQVEMLQDAVSSSIGGDTFIHRQCNSYVNMSLLWVFLWGLGFRLVAFFAVRWAGKRA